MMFYDAISCWDNKVWVIEERMSMEHLWNKTVRGKQKSSEKICNTVTVSSTNPTWSGLEVKLRHQTERRWHSQPMLYFTVYLLHWFTLILIALDIFAYWNCQYEKFIPFVKKYCIIMWSRVSRISYKLIKSLNRFVIATEGKILPENFTL